MRKSFFITKQSRNKQIKKSLLMSFILIISITSKSSWAQTLFSGHALDLNEFGSLPRNTLINYAKADATHKAEMKLGSNCRTPVVRVSNWEVDYRSSSYGAAYARVRAFFDCEKY